MAPSEIHGGILFIQNILKEKENLLLLLIDMVLFNVLIKKVITVVWFFSPKCLQNKILQSAKVGVS